MARLEHVCDTLASGWGVTLARRLATCWACRLTGLPPWQLAAPGERPGRPSGQHTAAGKFPGDLATLTGFGLARGLGERRPEQRLMLPLGCVHRCPRAAAYGHPPGTHNPQRSAPGSRPQTPQLPAAPGGHPPPSSPDSTAGPSAARTSKRPHTCKSAPYVLPGASVGPATQAARDARARGVTSQPG